MITINDIRMAAAASDAAYAPDRGDAMVKAGVMTEDFIPVGPDAFVCSTSDVVIAAFCGTRDPHGWLLDLSALFVRSRFGGKIHIGFSNYYEPKREAMDNAIRALYRPGQRLILTGHSLGATGAAQLGIDTLMATAIHDHEMKVITFGGPRTGNGEFAQINQRFFDRHGVECLRLVNSRDPVPRAPLLQGRHFGTCGVLDTDDGATSLRSVIPFFEKLGIDVRLLAHLARTEYHRLALMAVAAQDVAGRREVALEVLKFVLAEHSMAHYRARVDGPLNIQASLGSLITSENNERIAA